MASMENPEIVVVGGGYAGLTAAARLGEAGLGGRVTLIDAKDRFVERIRLHEVAAGGVPLDLAYRPFLAQRGITFVQGRVETLDPARYALSVTAAGGTPMEISYDLMVLALGSHTDRSAVPGAAEYAHALDSLEGAEAVADIARQNGARLLIVGGGLTGIEAAAEFAERLPGAAVTLAPGSALRAVTGPGGVSPGGMAHVRNTLDRFGVSIVEGSRVERVSAGEAVLGDGRSIGFDVCLWAAGFRPPPLARDAGLTVNAQDQIVTDTTLRSVSHPDILAVGDAAEIDGGPGGLCRMSCAAGRPQGEAAAKVVLAAVSGGDAAAFSFGYTFRCVSLGRTDGLIQFVDEQDRPAQEFWGGERAARWKEYICRRTLQGVGFNPELGPPPDEPPTTRTPLEKASG